MSNTYFCSGVSDAFFTSEVDLNILVSNLALYQNTVFTLCVCLKFEASFPDVNLCAGADYKYYMNGIGILRNQEEDETTFVKY